MDLRMQFPGIFAGLDPLLGIPPRLREDDANATCPSCGNLQARHREPVGNEDMYPVSRWTTFGDIQTTSWNCLACKVIVIGLKCYLKGSTIPWSAAMPVGITCTPNTLTVSLWSSHNPLSENFTVEFHRAHPNTVESPRLSAIRASARHLSPRLSIAEARQYITEWVEKCDSHNVCRDARMASIRLPTRLIAVGAPGEDPRLYEPREVDQASPSAIRETKYVALSHCWGQGQAHHLPKTIKTNLEERKHAIPSRDLPQTFIDAVQLCRALEIPYLWIDSLCIIQDDTNDWEREASRMASVYRNAWLTISADGATSSAGGLFKVVSERVFPPSIELCPGIFGRLNDLFKPEYNSVGWPRVHRVTDRKHKNQPLRQRAWTFQEWTLSPRVVHFCSGELLWDCLEQEGCECQLRLVDRPRLPDRSLSHTILSRIQRFSSSSDNLQAMEALSRGVYPTQAHPG